MAAGGIDGGNCGPKRRVEERRTDGAVSAKGLARTRRHHWGVSGLTARALPRAPWMLATKTREGRSEPRTRGRRRLRRRRRGSPPACRSGEQADLSRHHGRTRCANDLRTRVSTNSQRPLLSTPPPPPKSPLSLRQLGSTEQALGSGWREQISTTNGWLGLSPGHDEGQEGQRQVPLGPKLPDVVRLVELPKSASRCLFLDPQASGRTLRRLKRHHKREKHVNTRKRQTDMCQCVGG